MAVYVISGADKATGEAKNILVEARDDADASNQAFSQGMLVSSIRALTKPTDPPEQPPASENLREYLRRIERNTSQRYAISNVAIGVVLGVFLLAVLGVILTFLYFGLLLSVAKSLT